MRIDKDKLERLMSLDDDALWGEISGMARGFGFNIGSTTPKPEDMQKIRDLLSEGKISPAGAMKIMKSIKRER